MTTKTTPQYEAFLRQEFLNQVNNLTDQLLARFDAGRKKYGNHLSEIDFTKEIHEEKLDLIIYSLMAKINIE